MRPSAAGRGWFANRYGGCKRWLELPTAFENACLFRGLSTNAGLRCREVGLLPARRAGTLRDSVRVISSERARMPADRCLGSALVFACESLRSHVKAYREVSQRIARRASGSL